MPELNVTVKGKIAQGVKGQYAVCGNSDYVVKFDFDDEWTAEKYKTARFIWNEKYEDVVFEGNECNMPVISDTYNVKVGVFAGDLQTTTPAIIITKKSILCGSATAERPSEDVYSQIMALLNDLKELSDEELAAAIEKYFAEDPIAAEIALNTAARHTHDNKSVIDLLTADDTGTLLYDGKTVTGASDLTIGMAVEGDGENFKVTSCDATIEQIDDALVNGQRIAVVITGENAKFLLPMLQGTQGEAYYFGSFLLGQTAAAYVWKDTSSGISTWTFGMYQIEAESIDYSNAALPNISTVGGALDELVPNSHTHANKDILDKISDSNGKLQYDGSDVGLKGDKGDKGDTGTNGADGKTPVKGTDYWTAADKQEIVNSVLSALPTWTGGSY